MRDTLGSSVHSTCGTLAVSIGCFLFFFLFSFLGNFFTSWVYESPPVCVTPACQDELNVNFVIPKLCCSMLPFGEFISYANETVDFLMPQFLAVALAVPVCRQELVALTQNTWSWLQATQQLRVNVFENVGAAKLPYCNETCLTGGTTQINLYISEACVNYCPRPNATVFVN